LIDSYYLLYKELDKARVFVVILKVIGSIKDITKSCNRIINAIYGDHLIRVEVFIRKGKDFFAKYMKKPNEVGYFKVVTDSDILPNEVGEIVLSDKLGGSNYE
jgi:hypothetical protein